MRKIRTYWRVALLAWAIPAIAPAAASQAPDRDSFRSSGLPESARDAWDATVLLETRSWRGGLAIPSVATGSGLIIDRDAGSRTIWVATSSHVVSCPGACLIRIHLPREGAGRVSSTAELVWRDSRRDLALLRATAPRKARLRVARTAAGAGPGVLAIGFPDLTLLGDGRSVRQKRYSTGRLLDSLAGFRTDYLSYGSTQTAGRLDLDYALIHDAPILPGSSGGPLVDSRGFVIGINTGSLTTRGTESCAERRRDCRVHLAVPIGELLEKVSELIAFR